MFKNPKVSLTHFKLYLWCILIRPKLFTSNSIIHLAKLLTEDTQLDKKMSKEIFLKSNYFKIVMPILIVAIIITLWKNGYEFVQLMYRLKNYPPYLLFSQFK